MTTQPVNVAVVFDTQGRVHLQRGSEDLDRFAQRLEAVSRRAGSSDRVIKMLESDLNRFASVLRSRINPALGVFNDQFNRMHHLAGRMMRFSFYALAAQFAVVGFSIRKLGQDFMNINQQFAQMEIVLKSVYGSAKIASNLRNELARITVKSPLPFSDLSNIMRAYAAIPATSSKIAQQAYQPGGYNQQNGFLNKGISVIEKLLTFRPDKTSEDAVFAIREALAGELRSLVRRFEFPPSLLIQASGKSAEDLKKSPMDMFNAIDKALSKIISPKAIQESLRQPSVLFQNLVEQLKEIPLLRIGETKNAGGVSIYNRILDYFMSVFNEAGSFIEGRFKPIGDRIGKALHSIFEQIFLNDGSVIEKLMGMAGLGQKDLPGLKLIDRVYEGFARLTEGASRGLPEFMEKAAKGADMLLSAMKGVVFVFDKIIGFFKTLFEISPGLGVAGLAAAYTAPSLIRGASGLASESFIRYAQQGRLAFNQNFISPNNRLPNAQALTHVLGTQLLQPVLGQHGMFRGIQPQGGGRFVGMAAMPPQVLAALGLPANATAQQIRQAMSLVYASAAGGPLPTRFQAGYSAVRAAAPAMNAGGISSRLGGLVGGTALALGASSGFASAAGASAMGIGALVGSMIVPALIAIAGTAAFTFAIDKGLEHLRNRSLTKTNEELKLRGVSAEFLAKRAQDITNEGAFAADFESLKKELHQLRSLSDLGSDTIDMPNLRAFRSSRMFGLGSTDDFAVESLPVNMDARALIESRRKANADLQKLTEVLNSNDPTYGIDLEYDPSDFKVENWHQAMRAMEMVKLALERTDKAMSRVVTEAQLATNGELQFGPKVDARTEERFNQIRNIISGFKSDNDVLSVTGFIEQFDTLQEVANVMNSYKEATGSDQIIEEMEAVLTKLQSEQNPFHAIEKTFQGETERMSKFLESMGKVDDLVSSGAFDKSAKEFDQMISTFKTEVVNKSLAMGLQIPKELMKALDNMNSGEEFAKESVGFFKATLRGNMDKIIADSFLAPSVTTFQAMFSEIGNMSASAINNNLEKAKEQFSRVAGMSEYGGQPEVAATIRSALGWLDDMPTFDDNLTDSEASKRKIIAVQKLSDFLTELTIGVEALGSDNFANPQRALSTVGDFFRRLLNAAKDESTKIEQQQRLMYKDRFAQSVMNMPVSGSGPAASLLRQLRAGDLQFNNREGYNVSQGFMNAMQLDPNGVRGPEAQLAQARASRELFTELGNIELQYSRLSPLNEEARQKSRELAEAYLLQAEAANKVVESMEGKGGAIGSFVNGIKSVLSEWKANMTNFTEIGVSMMNNFASGLSNAFTQIIMKSKSAKEAFRDFALSFIEMAVQMLMQKAVMMIFGAFLGGLAPVVTAGVSSATASSSPIASMNSTIAEANQPFDAGMSLGPSFQRRSLPIGEQFTSKLPRYADAGFVSMPQQSIPKRGTSQSGDLGSQSNNVPVNVVVNVNNQNGTITTEEDAKNRSDAMARGLSMAIQSELVKQHRQGGIFRRR
jgi:hypothetical protein